VLAAAAIGAALISAAHDLAETTRDRVPEAARLWPDPVADADRRARELADGAVDAALAFSDVEALARAIPRRGAIHLRAGMLAASAHAPSAAQRELERARRADPFHGELQASVARERLAAAVERRDPDELDAAARSFAAAVAVGAMEAEEAYTALSAADAPRALFTRIAARDPERLTALVEHQARRLDREGALEAANELDAVTGDRDCGGLALAHRRLGGELLAAGRASEAVEDLEAASSLAADPDALALSLADARLQTGQAASGVAALLAALRSGHADAVRAAGSIRSASAPDLARAALFEAARAGDGELRRLAASVFAELGERARGQELLALRPAETARG
jgi:hypothetical protein